MAPFKLFRLGQGSSSRSTSQETEPDQTVNSMISTTSLNKLTTVMKSSSVHYLTVDESDQVSENSSLMSLNNDQRALLSSNSTADQIGYSSPQLSDTAISLINVRTDPPPSYEFVMKEKQLLALDKENNAIQTTIHTNLLVESFYVTSQGSNNNLLNEMNDFTTNNTQSLSLPIQESLLIEGNECTDECSQNKCNCIGGDGGGNNNDDYGEYGERCMEKDSVERCSYENTENNSEIYRTCSEDYNNCSEEHNNCSEDCNNCSEDYNNCSEDHNQCSEDCNNCSEDYNNCPEEYSNQCQNQYHDDNYSNQQYEDTGSQRMNYVETKGPEILYKSSKELYKAVAKQCGLKCKMTDTCRCVDCQSNYFDCEFDQNENEKTDGGLGAGTPMFLNEVLHGTACIIL